HAMVAQMTEKPAGGELFAKHQRRAAIDRCEGAEELRRSPAEGAEIIEAIVGAHAKAVSDRIDVGKKFAKIQNYAFRLGAGPGSEQDHGVVVRRSGGVRLARRRARKFPKDRVGGRRAVASD